LLERIYDLSIIIAIDPHFAPNLYWQERLAIDPKPLGILNKLVFSDILIIPQWDSARRGENYWLRIVQAGRLCWRAIPELYLAVREDKTSRRYVSGTRVVLSQLAKLCWTNLFSLIDLAPFPNRYALQVRNGELSNRLPHGL
jgi:hypothetical protein